MANLAKQYFFNSTPQNAEIFEVYKRFMNSKHSFLHICKNDFYLNNAKQFLKFFLKDTEILEIPAWDINPYDNVSPANEIVSKRLKSFSEIIRANNQGKKHIVLTTATAITQRNIPQDILANSARTISKGDEIDRDELTRFLVDNSYINIAAASDHGEFSIRGSIIDIFPPGKEYGLRLDFFGDEVESIREYDPLTQISRGNVDSFDILPAGEIILSEKNIEVFKTNFIKNFGIEEAEKNQIYNAITEGRKYSGMENYLPLFYENTDNLFDYCKDYIISFEQDSSTVLEERFEQIEDSYNARKIYSSSGGYESSATAALEPDKIYLTKDDIKSILNNREYYYFSKYNEESLDFLNGRNMVRHNLLYNPVKNFSVESKISSKNAFELVKEVLAEDIEQKSKRKNLIACLSQGSKERLKKMLAEHNISVVEIEDFEKEQLLISKGKVGLVEIAIDSGFENDKIRIITEPEILGDKVIRKSKSSKKAEDFIKEASNLESGELIVHQENGIGRFMGLETINIQNIEHDFIHLEYRDGDKFYVPVENIEMISRYGSNTENVELDKLGGANWQERAAKVKKRIKEIAGDLVDVAAKRQLRKGRVFDADSGAYDEFCSKFKYMETEDQLNAIDSVLGDLASGKPMDRLICGDVGFGKTEVALRASFAIIHKNDRENLDDQDNYNNNVSQVAIICPTTLLCRQHYNTFKERYEGTNFRVEQLSRMVSTSKAKQIKEDLKQGEIDIIIGTHALLSKNIEFKNLSMLVIDEEQRFGVVQKERLKKVKENTHVLTLTATPIPRTLQLSMTGLRELSLIATPPVDRLAVRSFIMPYDEISIREAILKEHYRGGKTYFVAPRISDIEKLEGKLKDLVPEVKIVIAHGQMKADELDKIMTDFYEGKFDVLLATTIVESGLDVPSANTIIIYRADMFGLAQLYQLRGRVGRGKIRAYAYLTFPKRKELTKSAKKRLDVMQKLDSLGAGFTLASYDTDIRGFGNLLGEEQSGNIKEVGVELYQSMLQEAIEKIKAANDNIDENEQSEEGYTIKINLGVPVLFPTDYIKDGDLRMNLYRRLGNIQTQEDIDNFAVELIDRFGPIPKEAENLLDTIRIKLTCKKLAIEKIDAGDKGAVISFRNNEFSDPDILIGLISKNPVKYKIKDGSKLVLAERKWQDDKKRVEELASEIKNILEQATG